MITGTSETIRDGIVANEDILQIELLSGEFDEVYLTIDKSTTDNVEKPTNRTVKDIVDLKFDNGLEDYVPTSMFKIAKIVVSRKNYTLEDSNWEDIAVFDYDTMYNIYNYIDRFVSHSFDYMYGITPIMTNGKRGEMITSKLISLELDSIYITDRTRNFKMEYDLNMGEQSINTDESLVSTLNGRFPVLITGTSRYKTGSLSLLPLSHSTIQAGGQFIDKEAELSNRKEWEDFLGNGNPKVIRFMDGSSILAVTSNSKIAHRQGNLNGLADISFDYTEIGTINYKNLEKYGLLNGDAKVIDGGV